jgi:hypothetical protein
MSEPKDFYELVEGKKGEIANRCEVGADDYFVSVTTDDYEGCAQMHVSVAKKLRAALGRAIKHVEATEGAGKS